MKNVPGFLLALFGGAFLVLALLRHELTTWVLLGGMVLIAMGFWLVDSTILTGFFTALGSLVRSRHEDHE